MRVVGIDLAGSEKRNTGYCCLEEGKADVNILKSNRDILEKIKSDKPEIIGIDAPLSLPKGRRSIDQKNDKHFRECDLELRKLGIRFFPITLGPMRMLTKRGMKLKRKIKKLHPDIRIIEVYPGATYDLFKTKRKEKESILALFKKNKIRIQKSYRTQDELDAVCCALTTKLFLEKKAIGIGNTNEGLIIVPRIKKLK